MAWSAFTPVKAFDPAEFLPTECCARQLQPQASVVGETSGYFGASIAVNGNAALVGASGMSEQGLVFEAEYDEVTQQWLMVDVIEPSAERMSFGLTVQMADSIALIYGRGVEPNESMTGHLDVFTKGAQGWSLVDSLTDANWVQTYQLFTGHDQWLFKVNADLQSLTIYAISNQGLTPIWQTAVNELIQDLVYDPVSDRLAVLTESNVLFYRMENGVWALLDELALNSSLGQNLALYDDQLTVLTVFETLLYFTESTASNWQLQETIEVLDAIDVYGLRMNEEVMMYNVPRGRYTDLVVMTREEQQWQVSQFIAPADNNPSDLQGAGYGFDLTNDRLLLGQWAFQLATGRLLGYDWDGSQWQFQQTINQPGATSSAEHQQFGWTMAQDGSHLAVMTAGATNQTDDVYLYHSVAGEWSLLQVLDVPGLTTEGDWPHGIDLHGNRLVIGVPEAISAWNTQGLVHVYEFNGQTWQHRSEIPSPNLNPETESVFGFALSLSGDRLAVASATINDNTQEQPELAPGRVMTYVADTGQAGHWGFIHAITAPDGHPNDHFGHALSMDEDWLVVGAPAANQSATESLDAAYVFAVDSQINANGLWEFKQKMWPNASDRISRFGSAVKLHGNQMAISNPGLENQGVVKMYQLSHGLWVLQSTIALNAGADNNIRFGHSLDLNDHFLAIGAPGIDQAPGSAFVLANTNGQWHPHIWTTPSEMVNSQLAQAVAVDGEQLFIAEPGASTQGPQSGAVTLQPLPEVVPPEPPTAQPIPLVICEESWMCRP